VACRPDAFPSEDKMCTLYNSYKNKEVIAGKHVTENKQENTKLLF